MSTLPDSTLQTHQHEVQRLLGKCLLRLQQYECLIKAIIADHEISGPVDGLNAVQDERIASTSRKTLGTLVKIILESHIVTSNNDIPDRVTTNSPEDGTSVSMRMHQELSDADFARTKDELNELVLLRNNLVHHFSGQHDLRTLDGCRGAQDALAADYSRIDELFKQLRKWAEDGMRLKQVFADFLQSDKFSQLAVNSDVQDSTVE